MTKLQARNEAIIDAPIDKIWAIITDINMLHKVNPTIVSATGVMNILNESRTCQISNRGKIGNVTERLIELEPEKKTVWTIESDNMGMSKMLKNVRFCFFLEKVNEHKTKVVNETWYEPANLIARVMNVLMMKKMIYKTQGQILANLKSITSN
ncbi:MAG TPA: SRPBCC family protein [Flavipsychrobacter sp.]|nr:SRPBCC family protein [Flavipsychrobacter sp.]